MGWTIVEDEEKDREFSPAAADDEALEKLRRQLEAKELEAKENYERLLRQAAEMENFKKRTAREKADAIRYANESLVKDLLPALDNLERALDYAKGGDGKPLLEGIEMVLKSLVETLGKHGVTQISALGERFDPERHEAIAQIESGKHDPNSVVQEHQKGYYLLDRLLRPAQVIVAKAPENKEEKKRDRGG
jgi:molecular chaperone GrpE